MAACRGGRGVGACYSIFGSWVAGGFLGKAGSTSGAQGKDYYAFLTHPPSVF